MAMHGAFATSDGAVISFTRWPSPGDGAPRLALVHSLALDRTVWDEVVARLRHEAAILTYDCRGHGRSDRRAGPFTVELFARDLAELLDHVGWPDAAIGGCSMGGCVALAHAGLYPARTRGLGLVDTTAWYGEGAGARFRERAEAARDTGMSGLAEFQASRWLSDEFRANRPDALSRAMSVFLANDFDCYAASCDLLGHADLRPFLPSIRVPVRIVVGEEDYATPVAMARALHEGIPHASLVVLPRARHLTPIERPDEVAAELRIVVRQATTRT
jgi:3-oxoadipate enol-lactonase